MHRPLVITEDQDLLDDLVRIAAAAGTQLDVAHLAAHARPYWNLAPVVVVGDDLAEAVAATAPPTRERVFLATRDPADPGTWRRCVAVGAKAVVDLPAAERRLVDEFADALDPSPRAGAVVCVVGGSGGVGASVLSTCLALKASSDGLRTLLIDADPLGGGLDTLLGHEESAGARWPDLVSREGRVSPGALQAALPAFGELSVLSFDRGRLESIPVEAMRSVLEAGARGFDLVVADLPRQSTPAAAEALGRAGTTLAVVTADVRGVLAAAQVLSEVARHTADIRAVVRPGVLTDETVASTLSIPCAGHLADHPRLTATLNRGQLPKLGPRTPLGALCTSLLRDLLQERA
ncbi:chromosome partitioning protein [Nonomuraea sp. NBC_01738]|uniref:septum site-determining protein Ssd n=1 Tax=Nonomuraea sp. NBC_01738 TaxID=2976003 RepID=UPI002E115A9F|nr:chromosome partitioning protein [Nonomuraea sp. NBC_01738]